MPLRRSIALVAILGIGAFVAIYWQSIFLGVAMLSSDSRPALLADAEWNSPSSARDFNARFVAGKRSDDLIDWLKQNDFAIDSGNGHAERTMQSLPCNERLTVNWQSDAAGRLISAKAVIFEAGCL
jgi:hypothetical protein